MSMSFMYRQSIDTVGGVLLDSPNLDLSETVNYAASQRELPICCPSTSRPR